MEIRVDSVDLTRLNTQPTILEGCIVVEYEVDIFERYSCHI